MKNKVRRWVVILGMHRSGTSAIAGALAHSGISFGDSFIELQGDVNEKGFWEHAELVAINEAILKELNAAWFDPFSLSTQFEQGWRPSPSLFKRMCGFLRHVEFADATLCGLKDPRLSVLLPCWRLAINEMGDDACYLLMNRDIDQVARSLQKRDQMSLLLAGLLWGEYTFSAEFYTQGELRFWVDYEAMLADPVSVIGQLQQQLCLPRTGISEFIDPTMQRQQRRGVNEPRLPSLDALVNKIASSGTNILKHDWSNLRSNYRVELATADFWLKALVTDFRTINAVVVASIDLGDSHSQALVTIERRDEQLRQVHQHLHALGSEHSDALDTLKKRDIELKKLNALLKAEGESHGYAIKVVEQRDQQLKTMKLHMDELQLHIENLQLHRGKLQASLDAIATRPVLRWFINRFVTEL
ncbi:sulfotransferase family protein [Aeromonas dhakensis]|uniref:sulfotransferase family protein n=1 Tax=Aeromonas dhakensis TaxID=196024 RepID=UPI00237833CA|nr:hypothetical protein [Aeromonas dhakensis]MDD9209916.1 hypothetical protein [Aeromonas dhakensis]